MNFMHIPDGCTHIAFADESNWNQGRFRSISLTSAKINDAHILHKDLDLLRHELKTSEFKWSKPSKRHGIALTNFFFTNYDKMRVDVLIWDTEDERHACIRNRDDKANFARMYYHLLHNVLKRRWPDDANWLICPDEHKEVDWLTLEQCLDWKSWAIEENLFTKAGTLPSQRIFYNIQEFRCVSSENNPLVQLSDMFAGLAGYSYNAFGKYQRWKIENSANHYLPGICAEVAVKFSKSDKERLPVLHHVREQSGKRKFQISLDSSKGLCSKSPGSPLNFWIYTPQRTSDKAPVKNWR